MNLRHCSVQIVSTLLSCIAVSVQEDERVLDACKKFSIATNTAFDRSAATIERHKLPRNLGISWTVSDGERFYVIDAEHFYVRAYTNGIVEREARQPGAVHGPNASEQLLWARAEAILKALDKKSKLTRWKFIASKSTARSPISPSFATCNFSQKEYGLDSAGVGNVFSVSFDPKNGKIAGLTFSSYWKYDRPIIKISSAQARTLATQVARKHFGPTFAVRSIRYQFLMPMESASSAASNKLKKERRIRAGYLVRFDNCEVAIDAESGMSLGEKRTR